MPKYLEYSTKLDAYYYDQKRKTTVVVLKIRNKRAIYHVSMSELLENKLALSNLHPLDLCIIGVLASTSSNSSMDSHHNVVSITDDCLMTKIAPLLEIIGRDYTEQGEIIILKIKPLNKVIKMTVADLYNNKKLINALKYQDALSLGYSVGYSSHCLEEKIIRSGNEYRSIRCLINGLFLSALIISMLMIDQCIAFPVLNYPIKITVPILLLPFLILMQNIIFQKHEAKDLNKLLVSTVLTLLVFLLYFDFIVHLAYPAHDPTTLAFTNLYLTITKEPPIFLLSFITTALANIYIYDSINKWLEKKSTIVKEILIRCSCLSIFFLISILLCFIFNEPYYLLIDYFYSLICIILVTLLVLPFQKRILASA